MYNECNSGNLRWVKLTLLFLQCRYRYIQWNHHELKSLATLEYYLLCKSLMSRPCFHEEAGVVIMYIVMM